MQLRSFDTLPSDTPMVPLQSRAICPVVGSVDVPKRREDLVLAVCDAAIDLLSVLFAVPGDDLRAPTRAKKHVARVRQMGMYALNVVVGMKMGDIALGFGRDRSTVIHACHLIEDMRDDEDFEAIITQVEAVFAISFRFVPIGKSEIADVAPTQR